MCVHVHEVNRYYLQSLLVEVTVPAGVYDRDAVKANIPLLTTAVNNVGLRVGINLCTVHIQALYDLMQVPCPRYLGCFIVELQYVRMHCLGTCMLRTSHNTFPF